MTERAFRIGALLTRGRAAWLARWHSSAPLASNQLTEGRSHTDDGQEAGGAVKPGCNAVNSHMGAVWDLCWHRPVQTPFCIKSLFTVLMLCCEQSAGPGSVAEVVLHSGTNWRESLLLQSHFFFPATGPTPKLWCDTSLFSFSMQTD